MQNKKAYPKGVLNQRYTKDRLRTMYKQDPIILAQVQNKKKNTWWTNLKTVSTYLDDTIEEL